MVVKQKPVKKEVKTTHRGTVGVGKSTVKAKKTRSMHASSLPLYDTKGNTIGAIELPKELIQHQRTGLALKKNSQILAQYIRVYLANQRAGTASTKTRGEVEGSTRKIYRQKGTGRARHGSIRAPIFVGGGRVFGPRPRDFRLSIPRKMKRAALFLMISEKVRQELLKVVAGMEAGEMKTKRFAEMFRTLGAAFPMLVVTGKASAEVRRAIRNIKSLSVCPYTSVNPYDLWRVRTVLFTKDGMEDFISYFVKGEKP